jgi:hypothetical protein
MSMDSPELSNLLYSDDSNVEEMGATVILRTRRSNSVRRPLVIKLLTTKQYSKSWASPSVTCMHSVTHLPLKQWSKGMMAHQVAFLMADQNETVLKNYFHKERRPDYMPTPLTEFSSQVISIGPVIEQAI